MTIASTTRIGITSPHIFRDGNVDMDLVRRYAARAEALGYASLWTQERMTGDPPILDPITFLSYVAGHTTRVRLGVSVLVVPRHNPLHLAKQLASLDQMSGGRLIVGVGLGGSADDLPMYGMSPGRHVRRFIEHIEIMKALWTGSPVSYTGDFYELDDVTIAPSPAQKPHPPLWFGATAEPAIRRALRLGDGWTGAGNSSRDLFTENLKRVTGWLAEEGRDPASFPISKRVYLAIDDDEERARRRLEEWFAYFYGNAELPGRVAIWGAPGRVQEQLAAWAEAGVSEFILNPVFDLESHLELLAEVTGLAS